METALTFLILILLSLADDSGRKRNHGWHWLCQCFRANSNPYSMQALAPVISSTGCADRF
jgi:hypothetical protein